MNARLLKPVDAEYRYVKEESRLGQFRKWHVEPLLNQAADLLDRCLRDRTEYDELRAKWFLLSLEQEAQNAELVLKSEILAAGKFEVPKRLHEIERDLEQAAASEAEHSWHNVRNHFEIAQQGFGWDKKEALPLGANKFQSWLARHRSEAVRDMKNVELQWDVKEVAFQKRGVDQERASRSKKDSGMLNGGPLDYSTRLDRLDERVRRDLDDALDRIQVAFEGLNDFYGFIENGGESLPQTNSISNLVIWVRGAIRWLLAFGQKDQSFTKTVSVRTRCGEKAWTHAWETAVGGTAELRFILDKGTMMTHRFVRMRGLSGFAIQKPSSSARFELLASAPQKAIAVQLRNGSEVDFPIDQIQVAGCVLGRVEGRNGFRAPEVCGQISLMNVSPISSSRIPEAEWVVRVSPIQTTQSGKIEDVELELSLVGIPRPAQFSK